MTTRQGLVPTAIVDKRGRQTTVHKKPADGSLSASKVFPAPVTQKSAAKQRDELETRVSKLFPEKYFKYVKDRIAGFSDESVKAIEDTAKKIIDYPKLNADLGTLTNIVADAYILNLPEEVFPFITRSVDSLSDEVALSMLSNIYRKAIDPEGTPATDEVLDAHVEAANKYFDMAIEAAHDIKFTYISNEPLFEFVARHPDKVDIILQHYLTYHPEMNGYEDFERDLDGLGELAKPIGEGWL
jgi:hypothetical protein